jgi:hypothetical protein
VAARGRGERHRADGEAQEDAARAPARDHGVIV